MKKQAVWQLHDAKARFGELFRRVRTEGPQRVVEDGAEAVVIVPAEDFDHGAETERPRKSLLEFFQSAAFGVRRRDLKRKRGTTRTIRW